MAVVWVSNTVWRQMCIESDYWFPLETGGLLLGYKADNGDFVIRCTTISGNNAKHRGTRYVPDYDYDCQLVEYEYKNSNGETTYLGDWHSHPNGHPYLSWHDRRVLRRISKDIDACQSTPLMLILGGDMRFWNTNIFHLTKIENVRFLKRYCYSNLDIHKWIDNDCE